MSNDENHEETHDDCNCGHQMDDAQLLGVQAENTIRLAIEWLQKDRLTLAAIFLSAAAKLIATSGETDGNASCLLHQARAGLAQKSGHKKAAVRHARKSLAIRERTCPADHYLVAIGRINLGECLAESGNRKGRDIMSAGIEMLEAADVGAEPNMLAWKEQTIAASKRLLASLG